MYFVCIPMDGYYPWDGVQVANSMYGTEVDVFHSNFGVVTSNYCSSNNSKVVVVVVAVVVSFTSS